jgi:hypothetical protein
MWAPSIVKKGNSYFLFFSANDIQSKERNGVKDDTLGGIGIGIASKPEGPYKDYLGKPLINQYYNKAQPIDQFVFQDKDNQYYIIMVVGVDVILVNSIMILLHWYLFQMETSLKKLRLKVM